MTVSDLYRRFCELYPESLSCDWDNDGIMCSPDTEGAVYRILCVLDVTEQVAEIAVREGFDLIISHHPLVFHPLKSVVGGVVPKLLRAGISVLSFHTRADAAEGGVNDLLCRMLALTDIRSFSDGIPRIGRLPEPVPAGDFLSRIKRVTGAPVVSVTGQLRDISLVAVCGGNGEEFVRAAAEAGADLFLTGEAGYHLTLEPPCPVATIGHDRSELQIVGAFAAATRRFCPGAKVTELPLSGTRLF